MNEVLPGPARTTTTLYSYLELLAREQAPRSGSLLLGLRWSFGLPAAPLLTLNEYSLPLNPVPLETVLAERGGLRIARHDGDDAASLYDHLATGRPAIAAVDTWHLPFRPAFHRVHSSRTVLVRAARGGGFLVRDGWLPAGEGTLAGEELDRARYSATPLDVEREPLFAGNPIAGAWFSVECAPPEVEDATAWMRQRLDWICDEMTRPHADPRGRYGMQVFGDFCRQLADSLDGALPAAESIAVRRGAVLLLRPELSSRLYLGTFLRNAAHRLGDPPLQPAIEAYRQGLGHWQAAMDVLTKTVRTRRPEYDAYIRAQLTRARDNEERLAAALAR
jgi:hypothetical protein